MTKTPIVGMQDGTMVGSKPQLVNYAQEVIRNPLDNADPTAKSALSLLPEEEQFIVESHFKRCPDIFALSESTLLKRMSTAGFEISSTENLLRNRFWMEYDHATSGDYKYIRLVEVIRGVCSFKFFRETFLRNQYLVAYLMLPPVNFKVKQEETLLFALDKMRQILDIPAVKADGSLNTAVLKAQMGVYQMLERRVQGEVVQKTLNAHALLPMEPMNREEAELLSEEAMLANMQALIEKQRSRVSTKAALHSDIFVTEGRRVNDK